MSILDTLPGVQENVSLADYTTFKIGGPARYFFVAKNQEDIIKALKTAKKFTLPFFILGGGSNLLVSDEGFNGLVIKIQNIKYEISGGEIVVEAGVSLSKLVVESVNAGLTGLEWAMGIPGTIAGAAYGNAGAYGHSISESIKKIITISPEDYSLKEYAQNECGFVYRGSGFSAQGACPNCFVNQSRWGSARLATALAKRASGEKNKDEIILEITLGLKKGDKEGSQKQIKSIILERKKKTPPFPSAGSFFKNYALFGREDGNPLIKKFPDLIGRVKGGKLGVGYLIDQCGLKGAKIGQAMISHEHANFIINLGNATAQDVLDLAGCCKDKVREKYGIELEEETRLIGF